MTRPDIARIACLLLALLPVTAALGQEAEPTNPPTGGKLAPAEGKIPGLEGPKKLLTPHHDHLAKLAGTWIGQVRWYDGPDGEPVDSRGFAVSKMILDDRFLKTEYKGDFNGHSILGFGLDGYDTTTGEHVSVWADSMGTSITTLRGTCDDDGKVITLYGNVVDPATGKAVKTRQIIQLQSSSQYTFESASLNDQGEYVPTVRVIFSKQ